MKPSKIETKLSFLLLFITVILIILHLYLTWLSDNNDLFSCSLLFWSAGSYLIWEKRQHLYFKSDLISTIVGVFLMTLILTKSLNVVGYDLFLRISPLISIVAVGLLASGWRGLRQYWQPLILFCFLAIPWELIYLLVDLSLLTTKFASFVLWLLGFDVLRQGVLISLPTGSIEVYNGCSGLRLILQLLGIAIIALVVFEENINFKLFLPIITIGLGFIINGFRVALMAVLVALGDEQAFAYWHLGNGSLVFSAIGVISLFLIGTYLYQLEQKL